MTTANTTEPRRGSDTVHWLVGRCGSCRFFMVKDDLWRRRVYQFIERLSAQEGRHVALGYCIRRDKGGEGPRADADTCQHYEAANNTPQRMARPSAGATYAGGDCSTAVSEDTCKSR